MNLISWFNADRWSLLGPHLEIQKRQYEGYQYLGMGSIVALFIGLLFSKTRKRMLAVIQKYKGTSLQGIFYFFLFLALSTPLTIGKLALPEELTHVLYGLIFVHYFKYQSKKSWIFSILTSISIVAILYKLGYVLASTGRMAWIPTYFLVLLLFSLKLSPRWIMLITLIQIADISPLLRKIRSENTYMFNRRAQINLDKLNIGKHIKNIYLLSIEKKYQPDISSFALQNNIKVGPVYTARSNKALNKKTYKEHQENILNNSIQTDTLYITDKEDIMQSINKNHYKYKIKNNLIFFFRAAN